jgi:putative salt-induced outer membrane protein YdiY
MMFLRRATLLVVMLATPLAMAQEGNYEGEAELGVLITSGNSEETSINSRLAGKYEGAVWRNTASFRSAYSEAEDETTAEKYRADAEGNYKFGDQQYWFLRGSYDDDRFSGYEYQSSVTTGYGNRVWNSGERSFLDLSIGAGYRYNRLDVANEDGERDEDEAIGRLAGQFDYALSESALFRQKLSTEIGLEDGESISESETSIQASLAGNLSMKAAYRVKHVSDAPPGSEKTDTETSLTLLYGF